MTMLVHLLALTSLCYFLVVAARAPSGSEPPSLPVPRPRELTCGAALTLAAVDPHAAGGADTVTLESHDPVPIELTGWTLVAGRRRVPLDHFGVGGDALVVPVPRLDHSGGEVHLVDPCGLVVASITWGSDKSS